MQKHKGEKRKYLLARGEVCCNLRHAIPCGDKSVSIDELIEPLPLRQLDEESQYAARNNEVVDNGIGFRTIGISNRYHVITKLSKLGDRVNGVVEPALFGTLRYTLNPSFQLTSWGKVR